MSEGQHQESECCRQAAGLVEKVTGLVREGNRRHIHVQQADRSVVDLPLTVAVVGAAIAPAAAAIGLIAALITDCHISVDSPPKAERPVA